VDDLAEAVICRFIQGSALFRERTVSDAVDCTVIQQIAAGSDPVVYAESIVISL
jgi:hypothetical protein